MEGRAFYNKHSQAQRLVGQFAIPAFVAAARLTRLSEGAPVLIGDFGSSQGANSLEPIASAIDALRERTAAPVWVQHVDLPGNDFSALFEAVASAPDSYARGHGDVFYSAIGRSFYEAVLAPSTLHLGWSASAVHWLQQVPVPIIGHIWPHGVEGEVRDRYNQSAATDWRLFLERRANELVPGGQMIVSAGTFDAHEAPGPAVCMDILNEIVRDMVAEGLLRAAEYDRFALPTVFRTVRQFSEPFGTDGFESSHGARLRLCSVEPADVPRLLLDRYREDGDAQKFGRETANFVRAYTAPVFRQQLDRDRRPEECDGLIDSMFARAAVRYATAPEQVEPRWRQLILHFERLS